MLRYLSLVVLPISFASGVLWKKLCKASRARKNRAISFIVLAASALFHYAFYWVLPIGSLLGLVSFYIGQQMCIYGITGGIASGKTTLCNFLKKNGFIVIEADVVSREILVPGRVAYKQVIKRFGGEIVNEDATINREKLRRIAFDNPQELKALESITHRWILLEIIRLLFKYTVLWHSNSVVLDASLLYETHLDYICSPVMVVHTDESQQLQRLISRDKYSSEETLVKMIRSQMPSERRCAYADKVFDNNSTKDKLFLEVAEYFRTDFGLLLNAFE